MKRTIAFIAAFAMMLSSVGMANAEINSVTPSTNDINRTNGWAHVDVVDVGIGEITLDFISTRSFASCFEYRTDGDTAQKISETNYNSTVTDGLYPFICRNNNSTTTVINANEYVEVRMVFGAEKDERFDWTRFDVTPVLTAPVINGFLNPALPCGAITNIHSTTVDWTDSTGGSGVIAGYEYAINYPLANGTGQGNWSTFVAASQYSGSLNEGVHTIKVRARDSEGNVSDWSNECAITADWTAPDAVITYPADAATVSGVADIRGSVLDANLHHYWLVIANASGTAIAGPGVVNETEPFADRSLMSWDTTAVADGTYVIKLEARDSANNKDSGSVAWHTVTVKNIPDGPANMEGCKNGGWKLSQEPAFKNQGDCVSWFQSSPKAKGNKK